MDVKYILFLAFILITCAPKTPKLKKITLPDTKRTRPDLIKETLFSRGLLTEYDIWEFLREHPTQNDVINFLGLPDSVWLNDSDTINILYYFISNYQDYNTIEINSNTNKVLGFEWD